MRGGGKERADSSRDMSLFGLEMERLSAVRHKDKAKAPREKAPRPKGEKPPASAPPGRDPKEKDRGQRPCSMDRAGTDRGQDKVKAHPRDRSTERRAQRESGEKSRSQTPPDMFFSSDEGQRPRPVRKIAMRRPRSGKDGSDSGKPSPHKDGEQDERKPGRSPKKRKQRRKRGESDDEEDERLEDGVTWYEVETCESDHCHRPAERRVQWVGSVCVCVCACVLVFSKSLLRKCHLTDHQLQWMGGN